MRNATWPDEVEDGLADNDWSNECEDTSARGIRSVEKNRAEARPISCTVEVSDIDELHGVLERQVEWAFVLSRLPILRIVAGELFLGAIEIEFEADPEIPDCHYVIFSVHVPRSQDAAPMRSEWYRRTSKILGQNCGKVRLVISIGQ